MFGRKEFDRDVYNSWMGPWHERQRRYQMNFYSEHNFNPIVQNNDLWCLKCRPYQRYMKSYQCRNSSRKCRKSKSPGKSSKIGWKGKCGCDLFCQGLSVSPCKRVLRTYVSERDEGKALSLVSFLPSAFEQTIHSPPLPSYIPAS